MSMFFRTVWITLRAANYTTQAFESTIKGLTKLQQAQLRLKMDASRNIFAVGMMYLAMGLMATMAISKIMAQSELGKAVLTDFGNSISKSMGRLGESLARILGPILQVVATILEFATSTPIIRELLAIFIVLGTTILIVAGFVKVFSGAIGILTVMMGKHSATTGQVSISQIAYGNATKTATASTMSLGVALGIVTAGFTIFIMLGQIIGSQSGAIVAGLTAITLAVLALAIALNILSIGTLTAGQLGALAAGVGLAAGVMAIQSQTEYETGTRMFTKTGMGIFHKGEIAYNPENKLPTQINRGLEGKSTSLYQKVTIDLSGSTIQTKMEEEELIPVLKRRLRNIVLAKE